MTSLSHLWIWNVAHSAKSIIQTMLYAPYLISYTMVTKPIHLLQSCHEEVIQIMKEQMASGKYKPSSASYWSTFLAVEKKGGDLRVVHNLQPLNAVTIRDATLQPRVHNMI